MKVNAKTEKIARSRRKMLKKVGVASAFVVPTLMTFSISELQADNPKNPSWSHAPGGNPAAPGQ